MTPDSPRILSSPECATVLRGIAEPLRLQILALLRGGPLPVHEITRRLGVKQYQASRHLGALHELGLLGRERIGRTVTYALAPLAAGTVGAEGTIELGCCQVSIK